MKENTLFELLENLDDFIKFKLSEKLKIYVIKSPSRMDRLMADCEEYYISEVPLRLLRKKVFKVYHYENVVEVFE